MNTYFLFIQKKITKGVGKKGEGLANELEEIKNELFDKRDAIRFIFIYFSMLGGHAGNNNK